MSSPLLGATPREVASVALSAAITLVGAWLLVVATGAVAIMAALLATAVYVPLRGRWGAMSRLTRSRPSTGRKPSPR